MKRTFSLFLIFCALVAVSCKDYKPQIEELQKEIDELDKAISDLEPVTVNLGALRDVLLIAEAGDPVVSVSKQSDGYAFQFKSNGVVNVGNQTAGVSVDYSDDAFFWTLGGQPLKDASGKTPSLPNLPNSESPTGR